MFKFDLNRIQRILLIGAHADDIEIGCGGTVLKLLDANPDLNVTWVVLSADGQRKEEAEQSAARFLGEKSLRNSQHDVQIYSFPDRFFPTAFHALKECFDGLKAKLTGVYAPDVIFTHHLHDRHQDHCLTSNLTWNTFRDHLILEYEIPKYEGDQGNLNFFVGVDESHVSRKTAWIWEMFPSQRGHYWFSEDSFRSLMVMRGLEAGAGTQYAEAFYARKLVI